MYYKDEGIILNSYPSTEADNIVEILLKHRGRISLVFKGVKKSKSRKLNSADMGNYVEVFVYRKNKEQLPYLREIKVKNHFYKIKKDHIKFLYLNYISELFLNFAHPGEVNSKLFNFLLKVLVRLKDFQQKIQLEVFIVYIEFRLIQVTGIMPDFRACHRCHLNKESLSYFFDYSEIVCKDCEKKVPGHFMHIDKKMIEYIEKINKHNIIEIESLKIDKKNISFLDKMFKNIINIYLNKELKSYSIIKKMLEEIERNN